MATKTPPRRFTRQKPTKKPSVSPTVSSKAPPLSPPTTRPHRPSSHKPAVKPKTLKFFSTPRTLFPFPHRLRSKRSLWLIGSLIFLLTCFFIYWLILKDLPSPHRLTANQYPVSSLIYDRHGNLLYEIYADRNRTPVSLSDLPPYVSRATIAIEDKDFYSHRGLSPAGISRALVRNAQYLLCQLSIVDCPSSFQGGSTITQQLVKNTLLTSERTLQRKIKEALLTLAVETIYTKEQILEMYLNQVPYGGTAYGLEAAAQTYFAKSAKDLTLSETSILAGLPAAPTRFSPFGTNPQLYQDRQRAVLRRMVEDEYLTSEQAEEALNEPVEFNPQTNLIHAPHFVLWVKELLVEKYGQQLVEQGGLRVTTTLDLDTQQLTETTVATEVAKLTSYKATNGAALITHPPTGQILALVGSADYFNSEIDGNVNLALRYRQPGSSIKPLNYAVAFDLGYLTPSSIIADYPTCFSVTGQPLYCPVNYDGQFHGPVQARNALASSYNIPAVRVLARNSLPTFIASASAMGITGWDDQSRFGLSLTLGGGEVRMLDMATAYGSLANNGFRVDLNPILKVTTHTGETLQELTCASSSPSPSNLADWDDLSQPDYCHGQPVLSPEAAYLTSHILSDNSARSAAFGSDSLLRISSHPEVSVKTGTTNDLRDNWTIGYNPDRLVAVWVGNFDNTPMSRVSSGVTGAAPIWNRVISQILEPLSPKPPFRPPGIVDLATCQESGLAVSPDPNSPCTGRSEIYIQDHLPQHHASMIRPWPIDKTNGQPATDKTPPENIEMQDKNILFDILGSAICTDCTASSSATIIKYPIATSQPADL